VSAQDGYEAVIGLETHIQLGTRSKIFCACKADSWGDPPNTNICPVCTGQPGVLPVLNRAAVELAVLLAAALRADSIQPASFFARKNYFYPDLPKGYQISQYDEPLARGGELTLPMADGVTRRVGITKLHLEEDAGKTVRQAGRRLIDFNRCGVPLVEMVTAPDLRSAEEAAQFLIRLRQLLRWLGVSEADMEKGQLRCDANVSIRPAGAAELNAKTEIKNVNSIDSLRTAIETEIERQIREVSAGRTVEAWTLDWDEDEGVLRKMRVKETEADYRYFREPDLLPVRVERELVEEIRRRLPELPLERRERLIAEYGLPAYDAEILTEERSLAEYFETAVEAFRRVVSEGKGDGAAETSRSGKMISNWMMNDVLRILRERGIPASRLGVPPQGLAEIVHMVETEEITGNTGKELIERAHETGRTPREIVQAEGLGRVSEEGALRELARQVLAESPAQVATYRQGKASLIGWFVGQMMRRTGGKADAQRTRAILEQLLSGPEGG
jgi:aspartyl-tRNA(Asn)/glutamyl-tRNA(Gln) amidotransferase subunit B